MGVQNSIGIACGLVHLHRHDIYHIDSMALRADNVLLDVDWSPKLKGHVDCVSLTRYIMNDSGLLKDGFYDGSAAERLRDRNASKAADVWLFGYVLTELMSQTHLVRFVDHER